MDSFTYQSYSQDRYCQGSNSSDETKKKDSYTAYSIKKVADFAGKYFKPVSMRGKILHPPKSNNQ